MKVENIKLSIWDIQPNPNNPRTITDYQLAKLVKSLREMPEMLQIRPLVVNQDNVVLGGNMRLKALESMNITHDIPVIRVEGLTKEQETEFVIKNNLSYGEWEWDNVSVDYDYTLLQKWGLDVPASIYDDDEEPDFGDDELQADNSIKMITLNYIGNEYSEMVDMLTGIQRREDLESFTEVIVKLVDDKYEKD